MYVKSLLFAFFIIIVGVGSILARCGNGKHTMVPRNDFSRQAERDWMVDTQIVGGGITDPKVVAAMRRVPRHRFIPDQESQDAYGDFPLPIGFKQTISQPFIVAFMTEALQVQPGERIMEIGTGSGYQAAILAEIGAQVFTIEIILTRRGHGDYQWPKIFPKTDERRCRVIECDSGCLSFGSRDGGLSLRARKTGFPT